MQLQEIQNRAAALIAAEAATPAQRALLDAALADLWHKLGDGNRLPLCVELPLLVHQAVTGDGTPAAPVSVAGYCIYAGAELLDDLMDGDLGPAWSRYHPAEVLLAGTTLIATVPALALATAHAPPRTIAALQRSLARGLLTMSAGQQSDLALTGSADAPLETVDAIAQQKSGALPAMLAAMAARLANAPARVAEQYERLGRALGTARQFRSDCHDLFGPRDSRDLAHGARGLPIALHLQGLAGAERSAFVELLDTARQSVAARQAVRRRLLDTGVLRACALLIALYCAEAREALTAAAPRAPAARRLQGLIDEVSFFAGQTGAHTAALGEDDATRSVDRLR